MEVIRSSNLRKIHNSKMRDMNWEYIIRSTGHLTKTHELSVQPNNNLK